MSAGSPPEAPDPATASPLGVEGERTAPRTEPDAVLGRRAQILATEHWAS
jgi:hypothetical protein